MNSTLRYCSGFLCTAVLLMLSSGAVTFSAPQPDNIGYRTGVLPARWLPSGPRCVRIPKFQVHQYNDDLYILRESGCSNYEKPFLYLLFGRDKVLLLDTGAGSTDVAQVVKRVIDHWLVKRRLSSIQLIAAHTHAHGDHISGDDQVSKLTKTVLISPKPAAA